MASSGTMPVVQGILLGVTAATREALLDRVRGFGGVLLDVGTTDGTVGTGFGSDADACSPPGGDGGGLSPPPGLLTIIAIGPFLLAVVPFLILVEPPAPPPPGEPPPAYWTTSMGFDGGIMWITVVGCGWVRRMCSRIKFIICSWESCCCRMYSPNCP